MPQDFVTDVVVLTSRARGGIAQFLGTEAWKPIPIRGKIVEHSPHVRSGVMGYGFQGSPVISSPGFGTLKSDGAVLNLPMENDFLEFRFPHHRKKEFFDQFLGATGGKGRLPKQMVEKKAITVRGSGGLHYTYGKMNTHQVKLLSGAEARSLVKDGIDAGMTLGESIGGVIVAAGASGMSAAALSGVTLGAGVVVVALVVAGTAAHNHAKNLKNKQVYFRISRSSESTTPKTYFPYEDKVYASGMFRGDSLTYGEIANLLPH